MNSMRETQSDWTKRDMLHQGCLDCDPGEYMPINDDSKVQCNNCLLIIERFLTKRERLAHILAPIVGQGEE